MAGLKVGFPISKVFQARKDLFQGEVRRARVWPGSWIVPSLVSGIVVGGHEALGLRHRSASQLPAGLRNQAVGFPSEQFWMIRGGQDVILTRS